MQARSIVVSVVGLSMLAAVSMAVSAQPEQQPDIRWEKKTKDGIASGGAVVRPAAGGELLFVVGDLGGDVYAFDVQSGDLVWNRNIGEEGVRNAPALLAGADPAVVFVLPSGRVVVLDAKDGKIRWMRDLSDGIVAAPTVSRGGQVLVGTRSGALHVLDENGESVDDVLTGGPIWHAIVASRGGAVYAAVQDVDRSLMKYPDTLNGAAGGDVIHSGGRLLPTAAPAIDRQGRLFYAFRGKLVVREPSDEKQEFSAPEGKPIGISLAPEGNMVWLAGESRHLGHWLKPYDLQPEPGVSPDRIDGLTGAGPPTSAPAVDRKGIAYLALSSGDVIAADASGKQLKQLWRFRDAAAVKAAPVVASGAVFLGDLGGHVYALETGTDTTAEAEWKDHEDWPTIGQNPQRTGQAVTDYKLPGELLAKVGFHSSQTVKVEPIGSADGELDDMLPGGSNSGSNKLAVAADAGKYRVIVCGLTGLSKSKPNSDARDASADTTHTVGSGTSINHNNPDPCGINGRQMVKEETVRVERVPVQRFWVGDPVPVPNNADKSKILDPGPELFRIQQEGESEKIEEDAFRPLIWRSEDKTMHAAAPGHWLVKWPTTYGTKIVVRVRVMFPEKGRRQKHLAGAPHVQVTDDKVFTHAFLWGEEGWKRLDPEGFQTNTPGRSIIALSDGETRPGAGEQLAFIAVESFAPDDLEVFLGNRTALIGSEIPYSTEFPKEHQEDSGSPHVWDDSARVNMQYYDRGKREGPIFPVNTDDNLLLAFYRETSALIQAGAGEEEVSAFRGWVDEERFYGKNKYRPSSIVDHSGNEVFWPVSTARYRSVWPEEGNGKGEARRLVIAETVETPFELGDILPPLYDDVQVYRQGKRGQAGYNPNEEHAWVQNGNLWALRSDLNQPDTSEPYVLLAYKDRKGRPAMSVVRVVADDGRGFEYGVEAGKEIRAPGPLAQLLANDKAAMLQTTLDSNAVFKDRTGKLWAYRAGHAGGDLIVANRYCYRVRSNFDTPAGAPVDDCAGQEDMVAWLSEYAERERRSRGEPQKAAAARPPLDVRYRIRWPEHPPTLKQGRALTVARDGLAAVHGLASVELLYQQSKWATRRQGDSVRLLDVASAREVKVEGGLPASFVFPRVDRIGDKTFFAELPPHLRHQLYYDHTNKTLAFRGRYMKGDGKDGEKMHDAPGGGAEYVLMNVISEADAKMIKDVLEDDGQPLLKAAVEKLVEKVAEPIVLASESVSEKIALATIGPQFTGFVSYVENDSKSAKQEPRVRLLRVSKDFEPGKVIVIKHSNPFADQVYIRHSGDFGGYSDEYEFRWEYAKTVEAPKDEDWEIFSDKDKVAELLEGEEQLADRRVRTRFRRKDSDEEWSTPTKPSLVEGWLKRVVDGVNAFDSVLADFRRETPGLTVSALEKAGVRYRGATPLTPEAAEKLGLIEVYETVYRSGKTLGIEFMQQEMQTFAGRLADLYLTLADDAYADAADPTLMVRVNEGDGMARMDTSRHAFVNQTATLLEEELALLRGIGGNTEAVRTAPAHNRLRWNFTDDAAQALYVEHYGIGKREEDVNSASDGQNISLDERAAQKKYPQGHGDAYGHYLTALKVYYGLLRDESFRWTPGPIFKEIYGETLEVDYFDERKLSQAAVGRARTGLDVIDLTHKRDWGDAEPGFLHLTREMEADPQPLEGQKDPPALFWGLGDWASRAGQGAYLDWVMMNALVPNEAPRSHELLGKLERKSVSELSELAALGQEIQTRLDDVLAGRNPLRVPESVIPFDINVQKQIKDEISAFDVLKERAERSIERAEMTLNEATKMNVELAKIGNEGEKRQRLFHEGERTLKSRLIRMFGTPFDSDIGSGRHYDHDYDGPDLDYYDCMSRDALVGGSGVEWSVELPDTDSRGKGKVVDTGTMKFGCVKDTGDARAQIGEIQVSLREMIMAKARFDSAVQQYEALLQVIEDIGEEISLTEEVHVHEINLLENAKKDVRKLNDAIVFARKIAEGGETASRNALALARIAVEALPKGIGFTGGLSVGWWADVFAPLAAASWKTGHIASEISLGISFNARMNEMHKHNAKELMHLENNIARVENGHRIVNVQLRNRLESAVRRKPELEIAMAVRFEALKQTVDNHRSRVTEAHRLLGERNRHRALTEVDIEKLRYRDMAFRFLRMEGMNRYREEFDKAHLDIYLLARQYDFETNYAPDDPRFDAPKFYSRLMRARTLGHSGNPPGREGLRKILYDLDEAYNDFAEQRGAETEETETAGLRKGLFRIPHYAEPGTGGERRHERWREILRGHIFDSTSVFPDLGGCCVDLREDDDRFLIIPFSTPLAAANFGIHNHFGAVKTGGESGFSNSYTGSVLVGVKVHLHGYEGQGKLTADPRVYLVPAGQDMFRSPVRGDGPAQVRVWEIGWRKKGASDRGSVESPWTAPMRRFTGFRADYENRRAAGRNMRADDALTRQHYGRSVYNTRWYLIVPMRQLGPTLEMDEIVERFLGPPGTAEGVGDIYIEFHVRANE